MVVVVVVAAAAAAAAAAVVVVVCLLKMRDILASRTSRMSRISLNTRDKRNTYYQTCA